MKKSRVKTRLQNSIMASKIDFDSPSEVVRFQIEKQLSKQLSSMDVSVYHMESLYRDNTNDKYELEQRFLQQY
jgi:hypothetical protein